MLSPTNNLFLKKDKIYDFVNNSYSLGFIPDEDGDYVFKKVISEVDQDLYIQFIVAVDTLKIYIELNVPASYWIQLGFSDFEPLLELYRQGYIEIKKSNDEEFVKG